MEQDSQSYGRLREESSNPCVGRVTMRFVAICLTLALSLGVLSGCGGSGSRSVRLGTYVGQLCEAIGPLEVDLQQKFAKVLSKYTLRLRSPNSRQEMINALTTVIADSRHVVTTIHAVGAPDIHDGRGHLPRRCSRRSTRSRKAMRHFALNCAPGFGRGQPHLA